MPPHGSSPTPTAASSPSLARSSSSSSDPPLPRGRYPLPADLFFVPGGLARTADDAAILSSAPHPAAGPYGSTDHPVRPGSSPPAKIGPGRRHSRSFGRRSGRGSPIPPPVADGGRVYLDAADPGATALRALEADAALHAVILSRSTINQSQPVVRSMGSLGMTSLAVSEAKAHGKRPGSALSVDTSAVDDPRLPLTCDSSSAVSLCPSLSALARAAFHPLTGARPAQVREWADAMILSYSDLDSCRLPPSSPARRALSMPNVRGRLQALAVLPPGDIHSPVRHAPPRPCGYVFKAGDIAWNCRTCQQDATCVLCDECFRSSDHTGHEVTFHRTSSGGCCDCGDTEAWRAEGCCKKHRPKALPTTCMDAVDSTVQSAEEARRKGEAMARSIPQGTRAALGVVIGAAIHAVAEATEGTGIGTDLSQWQYRWAEQACQIAGMAAEAPTVVPPGAPLRGEERKRGERPKTKEAQGGWCPAIIWRDGGAHSADAPLPEGWCLHVRLHNDDVHTFDEVIEALFSRGSGIVGRRQDAENLTNHVDSDGQVTVMTFDNFKDATAAFHRLKERGLQVSCVTTTQVNAELRAVNLLGWITDLCSSHPGVSAIVAHALLDVGEGEDLFAGVPVWPTPRMIPQWLGVADPKKRWEENNGFPVEMIESYLTTKQARDVHASGHRNILGKSTNFATETGSPVAFYRSTWSLNSPSSSSWIKNCEGLLKSPHSLWGVVPVPLSPLTSSTISVDKFRRYIMDTDLRKRQVPEALTSTPQTHHLPGLHAVSGVALEEFGKGQAALLPTEEMTKVLAKSSYVAPLSPLVQLLLMDPYPTKALRARIHSVFLPLLVDARFKARFGAAFAIAYKSLSTLFCAGVGTDGDSAFSFTVQIFTTGSLVRSLCNPRLTAPLLDDDSPAWDPRTLVLPPGMRKTAQVLPLPHLIVRSVHTNLEGLTKNVQRLVLNVGGGDVDTSSLTWQEGEHPRSTPLLVSGCDEFLDNRSTRHKRLPHMLRDLEYLLETPATARELLLDDKPIAFADAWGRLLRLSQGMDEQKRKPSGSHVEYETQRWIEAFSWTLNLSGVTEALGKAESYGGGPEVARVAVRNLIRSLLKEMKMWLYREKVVGDVGLKTTLGYSHHSIPTPPSESLQKCTLDICHGITINADTDMKMTEGQLDQFERTLSTRTTKDLIRVTHSPLAGDKLSLHIHLHRALARVVRSLCSVPPVPGDAEPWRIPVVDERDVFWETVQSVTTPKNLKVHWTSDNPPGGDVRAVQAATSVAWAKIVHSLLDHPLRCLVATKEIEAHMWARNGQSMIGMAVNYSTPTLCRNFRDLDLTLVQFSAAGFALAGPTRTLALLVNRFSLDGYMCDPPTRTVCRRPGGFPPKSGDLPGTETPVITWASPPRMSDPDHATLLTESFFVLLCLMVTEMPPPAPTSATDVAPLDAIIRRELLHALSVGPCPYSEAFSAALAGVTQNEGHAPPSFRSSFGKVMAEIGQEGGGSTGADGGATSRGRNFELRMSASPEYDPCFPHMQRSDHQGAMEAVARKRRAFLGDAGRCLPLVAVPPSCHPRFLPARLILHVPGIDEAMRRTLLFAVTGGKWLPPLAPEQMARKMSKPFGPATVASSAVSFLEVLQVLTLQVHTLSELNELHEKMPLDPECDKLSKEANVENYLKRLIHVPASLKDCWAFGKDSPLPSAGSAANRPSILGFLIILYEHRNDRKEDDENTNTNTEESSSGGARSLVSDGLRWFLRVVAHLTVETNVKKASDYARDGTLPEVYYDDTGKTIDGMLRDLPGLWPRGETDQPSIPSSNKAAFKAAQKAAQAKALKKMLDLQKKFAGTLDPSTDMEEAEEDQCIICRCSGNGPVGSIGLVQRSRLISLRNRGETSKMGRYVRVVGDKGCQVRATEALDSVPLAFLPVGSVVEMVGYQSQDPSQCQDCDDVDYTLKSRRVKVRVSKNVTGWASVSSVTGYVILAPLMDHCHGRWGTTRPVVHLCGHTAHISCVEAHCLSLHQKATDDQPYDGRFAANIQEGEFLCPLCKQLSNVVIPKVDAKPDTKSPVDVDVTSDSKGAEVTLPSTRGMLHSLTRGVMVSTRHERSPAEEDANGRYGDGLLQAMQPVWENPDGQRNHPYHSSILLKWDYDEPIDGGIYRDVLRNLRTMHIGWSALGYKVSSAEASARMEHCDDPWNGYDAKRRDTHTENTELVRLILSTVELFLYLNKKISASPSGSDKGLALIPTLLGQHLRPKPHAAPTNNRKIVTSIIASLPCHISRDLQLHHRHIARAAATGRWIAEGSSPTPLAVRKLKLYTKTLSGCYNDASKCLNGAYFRPGIASGFLYVPTLAWDLNTLAAAVLSTLIADQNITCDEVLEATHSLLVARLIQAAVTPKGFVMEDGENESDYDWDPVILTQESTALRELLGTIYGKVRGWDQAKAVTPTDDLKFMRAVGFAILPFARALVLLLRGLSAILRARGINTETISIFLDDFDTMFVADGLQLACMIMGMPLPSVLVENAQWSKTIDIWVRDVVFLESHHGSRGQTVQGRDLDWKPSYYEEKDNCKTVIMEADEIGSGVEIAAASQLGVGLVDSMDGSSCLFGEDYNDAHAAAQQGFEGNIMNQASVSMDPEDDAMEDDGEEESNDDMMVDMSMSINFDGTANSNAEASDEEMDAEAEVGSEDQLRPSRPGRDGSLTLVNNGSIGSVSVNDLGDDGLRRMDKEHASVMRGGMIPFQPSLLGREMVGVGPRQQVLDMKAASKVMCDLSHLGMLHRPGLSSSGLIRLPKSFVELYGLVNSIMGTGQEESDELANGETAICLLTGAVMRSGAARRPYARDSSQPGACTVHARKVGSGVGIFFLISKCTILLVHNNKSAYSASLYVDENGEEDPGLRRGRPLFLKETRYEALEKLWRSHGCPREVAQIRSTSERVIRDNWY